eukprot:642718-Prymnesium_polylepis.1
MRGVAGIVCMYSGDPGMRSARALAVRLVTQISLTLSRTETETSFVGAGRGADASIREPARARE